MFYTLKHWYIVFHGHNTGISCSCSRTLIYRVVYPTALVVGCLGCMECRAVEVPWWCCLSYPYFRVAHLSLVHMLCTQLSPVAPRSCQHITAATPRATASTGRLNQVRVAGKISLLHESRNACWACKLNVLPSELCGKSRFNGNGVTTNC